MPARRSVLRWLPPVKGMRKEIEIVVRPDGNVEIETHGFKGPSCLEAVKPFEDALGEVTHRELTSEYYERETGQERERTRGR